MDTHSLLLAPATLRTPSSLGCLASRFYLWLSVEKTHRYVCVCVLERNRHTGSCVYRFGAVIRGCAVYLSFSPPLWVNHLLFHFLWFDWDESVGLQNGKERKEGGVLLKITSNNALTLLQIRLPPPCRCVSPTARLTQQRWRLVPRSLPKLMLHHHNPQQDT